MRWQTNRHTNPHTYKQTLLKTISPLLGYRCEGGNKVSCRREAARCSVSLTILISNSSSLIVDCGLSSNILLYFFSILTVSNLYLAALWRTSSSSRVGVSKASAFRFVSWIVCSPYPTYGDRAFPVAAVRIWNCLPQHHICSVASCLLLSLEDILLRTLLPVITVVVPAKWYCHLWTR